MNRHGRPVRGSVLRYVECVVVTSKGVPMARLGELERAVMDVLWSANGSCTAREIVTALPDRDLAATTVLTVLSRLERKALVERDRDGRAHRYRPVASQEEHA